MKIMPLQSKSKQSLPAETAELRARLEEAEEALRAIRDGEVDAIIVGEHIYMLERAGTSSHLFRGEVLGQINDAVIAFDNDLRVTYLNPAAEQHYGVTASEALGRLQNELYENRWLHPEDEAAALAAIEATGSWRGENTHVTRDGTELHVESVVNRLKNESGTPIGLLAVIRDISGRIRAENARAQLAAIVELSADAIYSTDLNGLILSWNKSAENLYGWPAEEIIGRPISTLIPPDRQAEEELILERLRDGERLDHYEAIRLRKDRTIIDVSISISPIKDRSGRIIGVSKVARNITERKQAELAQAYLASIVESADDAIISKTLQGIITSWNRGAEKIFGYTASEIIGLPINTLIPCDRQEEEVRILEKLGRGERVDHFETVRLRKDGTTVDLSITVSPIKDRSGRIIGASKIAHDITERKHAEAALRASQAQIATDLQAMMRLYEVGNQCMREENDFDQCLIIILEAAISLTGADKGNIQLFDPVSDSLVIAAHRGFEEPFLKFFARVRDDSCACGKAWQSGERVVVEDVTESEIFAGNPSLDALLEAGVRAVQSTCLMSSTGRLLGMISTHFSRPRRLSEGELRTMDLLARQATDYLERKKAEEALRTAYEKEAAARAEAQAANRSKDEFISLISHELRSPLNSILGYNRILRSNPHDTERILQASDIIERNARTQLRLIEDLLDIARIVSGKIRLDLSPTDIVPLLSEALNEMRPAAEAKAIEIRAHYHTIPETVSGDPIRLEQVIVNLLSNAIKFTPDGGRIELWLKRSDEELSLIISDTGKGIAPEFLPHIFEPFHQADSSSSRRHGGLGLGLALVKHLVELHGGTVEAASEGIGLGSTFTIKFPRVAQYRFFDKEPPTLLEECTNSLPETATIEGVRVLAVDDQPEAREALSDCLKQYGAVVTAVASGLEAVAILADSQNGEWPDVFICDIAMPDEDGYKVMERVRALEREREVKLSQRMPAIALTAMSGRENWVRALKAGFNTHIVKPIDPEELVMLIYSLVGARLNDA
jgi:PAS domain S-box-containing protein